MSDAPNFLFCVGAQKSGTTWLHDYFMAHPDVHVPVNKEMHYFSSRYGEESWAIVQRRLNNFSSALERRVKRGSAGQTQQDNAQRSLNLLRMHMDDSPDHGVYRELMLTGRTTERLVADISPTYALIGAEAYRDMLGFEPAAKFLFIMRDPLDRLLSSLRMFHGDGVARIKTGEAPDFETICKAYLAGGLEHIRRRSDYATTLEALTEVVPEAQRLVVLYEEMFTPEGVAQICDFAGIEAVPAEFGKVVRQGKAQPLSDEIMRQLEETVAPVREAVAGRFGIDVSNAWPERELME